MKSKFKKLYCLGFMFDENLKRVILIKKTHPDWQKGKYNGVGGKVEDKEYPIDAMIRKFEEETSVKTTESLWNVFAEIESPEYLVYVYWCRSVTLFEKCKTLSDEDVVKVDVSCIRDMSDEKIISNLKWLIPMALDFKNGKQISNIKYDY